MNRTERIAALNAELAKRILILDGSMGAYLQGFGLTTEDFHGERFASARQFAQGQQRSADADAARSHHQSA
jgi:methionine synthase I (cobalamin-dependent)